MGRYLLDTHILIWLAEDPSKLSTKAGAVLTSTHELYISHASVWEMAIKIKIGKLPMSYPLPVFVHQAMKNHQLQLLAVSEQHIYATLSLDPHHRDPFDRMLIAQSLVEDMPIVSSDDAFDAYGVTRIWK